MQALAATQARLDCMKDLQAACVKCIILMHHIGRNMDAAKDVGLGGAYRNLNPNTAAE